MMPQSKTDASKLKKYLTQRKRNALVGPPETHTSLALKSLLEGRNNNNKQTKKRKTCRVVKNRACTASSTYDDAKRKSLKRNISTDDTGTSNDDKFSKQKRIRDLNSRNLDGGKKGMIAVCYDKTASHVGGSDVWNKVKLMGSKDKGQKSTVAADNISSLKSNDIDDLEVISNSNDSMPKNPYVANSKSLISRNRENPSKHQTLASKKAVKMCVKKQATRNERIIQRETTEAMVVDKDIKLKINETDNSDRKPINPRKVYYPHEVKIRTNNSSAASASLTHNTSINTTCNSTANADTNISSQMRSIFTSSILSKKRSTIYSKDKTKLESRFLQKNINQSRKGLNDASTVVKESSSHSESTASISAPSLSQSAQSAQSQEFYLSPSKLLPSTSSGRYQQTMYNIPTLPSFNCLTSKDQDKTSLSKQSPEFEPTTNKNFNPPNKTKQPRKKKTNNDNFVRLNLRNSAGSCRGARNLKKHNRQKRWNAKRREMCDEYNHKKFETKDSYGVDDNDNDRVPQQNTTFRKLNSINDAIDPIDDYLDGLFHEKTAKHEVDKCNNIQKDPNAAKKRADVSKHPLCTRHNRPCRLLVVKKNTTGNKGRKFYVCSMPKGEQCNFFQWEDDTVEAAQKEIQESSSYSGFVARQVAAYSRRLTSLTVPELRIFAKERNLNSTGQKKILLTRLTVWVRDQICKNTGVEEVDPSIDLSAETFFNSDDGVENYESDDENYDESGSDDSDEDSTSSEELEICNFVEGGDARICTKVEDRVNEDSGKRGRSKSKLHEALLDIFGFMDFREGQEWAIRRCLEKKRSLLVAPTGIGKSLCYALPAALMDGICIVVSPLIALIEDQLRHLPPRIPAATLSGNISKKQMALIIDDITKGRYKILFVSPEKLTSTAFRRMLHPKYCPSKKVFERQLPLVSLLCLDEAHCLSQWGHNFRSSYLRIKSIVDCMNPQSVLALTATAGPPVIDDICSTLGIKIALDSLDSTKDTSLKVLNCNRSNIEVSAQLLDNEEEKLQKLLKLLKERPSRRQRNEDKSDFSENMKNSLDDEIEGILSTGSVIVYVWRKKDAELITEQLVGSGIDGGVVCYHGGMDSNTRSKAQAKFMRGKARICVATIAFGLGLNKSDVRGVVHMCLPSSPENYLQEIGRAGRDNTQARAIALVLKSELSQKHSLSYSNTLSYSQVSTLHDILRSTAQASFKTTSQDQQVQDLIIAIPIMPLIGAVDLKEETIHTFLSLLEDETPFSSTMVNIQGIIPDIVSITLKRRTIEELAEIEDIGRCILECGNVIEKRSLNAGTALENGFSAYSYGSIEFSVTWCARLLGPKAEPRNVYATLRRLQKSGELELKFNETGKSIYIKMNQNGQKHFLNSNDSDQELISFLYEYFSLQDKNQSSKVVEMYHIIRQISSVESNEDAVKSSKLFQSLIDSYFNQLASEQNLNTSSEEEILNFDEADKVSLRLLSSDVTSIMNEVQMKLPSNREYPSQQVLFGSKKNQDYTALLISKIFHGISSPSTPSQKWYGHNLWAKWRSYSFTSLHGHVVRLVEKSYTQ